jgi:hypothetical protein
MMTFLYILIAIILLVIVLGVIAPKNYEVSRSIEIKRNLNDTFSYLKSLKKQDEWSPWGKRDPNMKKSFEGTDSKIGAISKWEGNKDVGSGEQEITNITENQLIETQLRFLKPFKSTSDAYLKVIEINDGTKVTWGFTGKNKFPMSIMMLFMNMDKAIGKDFEEGLNSLKEILEK